MNIRTDYTEFINKRFGICTVIKQTGTIKRSWKKFKEIPVWELKCDCGNLVTVAHDNLTNIKSKNRNCGCLNRLNLENNKFGLLTAIKYSHTKTSKSGCQSAIWECLCDCGKTTKVSCLNLKNGNVQSCGCVKNRKQNIFAYDKHLIKPQYLLSRLKTSAKQRNIEFNITIEDIKNQLIKQNNKCVLSGLLIRIEDGTASVDRINSNLGYIITNIQLIYKPYNIIKNVLTNEQFIYFCKLVSDNNPSY